VGEWALPGAEVTTGLPSLTPAQALAQGAQSLVIGVAPIGGAIAANWVPALLHALEEGLNIVSGMHAASKVFPSWLRSARQSGKNADQHRTPPAALPIATGRKRTGKRLLTVGTDCALGKKYNGADHCA